MLIDYTLADGKIIQIEVSDKVAEVNAELERLDANQRRKDRYRKERSIDAMVEFGIELSDKGQNIEETAEQNYIKETLGQAISKLSDRHKLLVKEFYFNGKKQKEIATDLGVSEQAVSRQLKTVLKNLKIILENLLFFRG